MFGFGDVLAQKIENKSTPYDPIRAAQLVTFGSCIAGPSISNWYKFLDKLPIPKGSFGLVTRVALDQVFFAPVFIAIFFTVTGWFEGMNWSGIQSKLDNVEYFMFDVLGIYKRSY